MSPNAVYITVKFRWWAMPFLLGSLRMIEALHFLGILSSNQGLRVAESLGEWVVEHGVNVE